MKFSVGYQLFSDDTYINEIIKRKDSIYEVYFSLGGFANGRNDVTRKNGFSPFEAQAKQTGDLERLAAAGLCFNLLFNGNCYGAKAQSKQLFSQIGDAVDFVLDRYGLSSVTTTSPLIAKFIKNNFPQIDVRASVNMEIGSCEGMEYVAEYFDSYYVKREHNRNFTALENLKKWCDDNGKQMYLLANSGCLNNCSVHNFHDNLVAHENEIAAMDNGYNFTGICWEFYAKEKNREAFLSHTNYIRPEDVHLYEGLVPAMKLATRVNSKPVRILRAYIDRQSFSGNLPDLLEPNHSGAFYPYIIENKNIISEVENEILTYKISENTFIKTEEYYADK